MNPFSQDGLSFGAPEAPARWALIIGINKYPFLGDADLDGSVNDALGYKAVLLERFAFAAEQVTVLLDEAATRDAILRALDDLVARVRDGDQVVLTYSGHGRRIANPDSPEADRMDETFVPADSGSGFHPNRDIRDDDFLSRILALTERGAYVTFICDCCHSSASLRDEFSTSTRGIAADRRRVEPAPQQASMPPSQERSLPRMAARPRPATTLRRERYVYVAACRDSEQASEHIEQSEAGQQVQGALSFHLQRELFACRAGESMQAVIDRAFSALSTECPAQHPRAEGALSEAPLFVANRYASDSGQEIHETRVLVQRRFDKSVVLSVGRLHGETTGSRYGIYPPALLQRPERGEPTIGLVEVTAVNATTVSAKILSEEKPGRIVAGCLAVELSHSSVLPPLRLEISADPEHASVVAALTAALASRPAIQVVQGGSAMQRLYALSPRLAPSVGEGVGESAGIAVPPMPVPQLGALPESVFALVGRDGRLRAPPLPLRADGDVREVVALLSSLATYQMVLALEQRTSSLRGALQPTLFRRRPGSPDWQPVIAAPGGLAVADVGDDLSLAVAPLPNAVPAGQTLHLVVLYLAANGEVQVWASDPENPPQISSGREFVLGRRPGERRQLVIAAGFPPAGWEAPVSGSGQPVAALPPPVAPTPGVPTDASGVSDASFPRVQDVIKILVSPQPLQASLQQVLRSVGEGELQNLRPTAPPARILATALRGRKARRSSISLLPPSTTFAGEGAGPSPDDWAALSLPLIVQRRS